MNFYPWHIGDYLSHTRHLTLMEDLAYRRLLDLYYLHERPICGTFAMIARQIAMPDHQEDVESVIAEFFDQEPEADDPDCLTIRNPRADAEIARYHGKVEQARAAGKSSSSKRTFNGRSTDAQRPLNGRSTDVERTFNQPRPLPEPVPVPSPEQNQSTPPTPQGGRPSKPAVEKPDDVSNEVWQEWVEFRRKGPGKGPVTAIVVKQTRAKAAEHGYTLDEAFADWMTQGYRGWFPKKGDRKKDSDDRFHQKFVPGMYGEGIQDI